MLIASIITIVTICITAITSIIIISNRTDERGYYITTEEKFLDLNHYDEAVACVFNDQGEGVIRYGNVNYDWAINKASINLAYGKDYYLYIITKNGNKYNSKYIATLNNVNTYEFKLDNKTINLVKIEIEDRVVMAKISLLDTDMNQLFYTEITTQDNNYIISNTDTTIRYFTDLVNANIRYTFYGEDYKLAEIIIELNYNLKSETIRKTVNGIDFYKLNLFFANIEYDSDISTTIMFDLP